MEYPGQLIRSIGRIGGYHIWGVVVDSTYIFYLLSNYKPLARLGSIRIFWHQFVLNNGIAITVNLLKCI